MNPNIKCHHAGWQPASGVLLLSSVVRRVGVQQADDSDLLNLDRRRVVELELDILENEGPNVVTETVGIKMTLQLELVLRRRE